jgi:hypothetical protein
MLAVKIANNFYMQECAMRSLPGWVYQDTGALTGHRRTEQRNANVKHCS